MKAQMMGTDTGKTDTCREMQNKLNKDHAEL